MAEQRERTRGEDVIAGRNAVGEALRAGRSIDRIYVSRGQHGGALAALLAKAKQREVPVKEVDGKKLDFLCGGANHQGIAAVAAVKEYAELEDVFALAAQRGQAPFLILADELEDPHNLGAILRTAECVGAHGVVIPKRRAVGLTYAVGKASAGAVEYMPVVRVTNLAATIDELKHRGLWVYAADFGGESWCAVEYSGPAALVIGADGRGVSRLVREKADVVVSLPMAGEIGSLNASVACGVLCYEIMRQRQGLAARNATL